MTACRHAIAALAERLIRLSDGYRDDVAVVVEEARQAQVEASRSAPQASRGLKQRPRTSARWWQKPRPPGSRTATCSRRAENIPAAGKRSPGFFAPIPD